MTKPAFDELFRKLESRAKCSVRVHPLATIALYGPTNRLATKITVGIVPSAGVEAIRRFHWLTPNQEIRKCTRTMRSITDTIEASGAKSVVMKAGIVGCEHDSHPLESCPKCPYWVARSARV